jgi:hypothetical protein
MISQKFSAWKGERLKRRDARQVVIVFRFYRWPTKVPRLHGRAGANGDDRWERNWMLRRGTTANYTTQPPRLVVSFM